MKKLITALLICVLAAAPAMASGIDWESMTDQEITMALAEGEAVLDARSEAAGSGRPEEITFCDYEGLKVVLTGTSMKNIWGTDYLNLEYVAENASDMPYHMFAEDAYINDWKVSYVIGTVDLEPGKRSKGAFQLDTTSTGISDVDDVQSIEIQFRVGHTNMDSVQIPLFSYKS